MRKPMTALAAVFVFTACDGNPFAPATTTTTPATTPVASVISLPGTTDPAAGVSIFRYESRDAGDGSGYAESISYDPVTDRFFVDNLGFDGDNFYTRDDVQPNLGPFQVYENASFITDSFNGTPINQFQHKAIYGVSTSGNTKFAIVRTGQYVNYGFGGFLYERDGGVTLPTSGEAFYTGTYAAIRDFLNRGGLEYVTGTASIAIDFEDFNDGEAVRGQIDGRRVYSIDYDVFGTETVNEVTGDLNTALGRVDPVTLAPLATLPTLFFTVGPGTMDANGELTNGLNSYTTTGGALVTYETGTYYAMVSGANAEEIVGVVVVTSTDPRFSGVTARETGGFIVYR